VLVNGLAEILGITDNEESASFRFLTRVYGLQAKLTTAIGFIYVVGRRCLQLLRDFCKVRYMSFVSLMLQPAFAELYFQSCLVVSFFLMCVPVTVGLSMRSSTTPPQGEMTGGLENLKILLYEQTGLFLLASTLVLLVALIGAAVMTRNKR
jgi:hypothetical protein